MESCISDVIEKDGAHSAHSNSPKEKGFSKI